MEGSVKIRQDSKMIPQDAESSFNTGTQYLNTFYYSSQ
jgi:hypothetical protein